MPTDKELADAYRLVKDDCIRAELTGFASLAGARIDELDPPATVYPDGLYINADGYEHWKKQTVHGVVTWSSPDYVTYVTSDADVVARYGEMKPLRVLADDEIAVKRVLYPGSPLNVLRNHAGQLRGGISRDVLHAYIDALDAEAGDAK